MYRLFYKQYQDISAWLKALIPPSSPSTSDASNNESLARQIDPLLLPSVAKLTWGWMLLQHSESEEETTPSSALLNQLHNLWFCNSCCSDQWNMAPVWIQTLKQDFEKRIARPCINFKELAHRISQQSTHSLNHPFIATRPPWIPPLWRQLGQQWQLYGGSWRWQLPKLVASNLECYQCLVHDQMELLRQLVNWLNQLTKLSAFTGQIAVVVPNRLQAKRLSLQLGTVLSPSQWQIVSSIAPSWQELAIWPKLIKNQLPTQADLSEIVRLIDEKLHWPHDCHSLAAKNWRLLRERLNTISKPLGPLNSTFHIEIWLKLLASENIMEDDDLNGDLNRLSAACPLQIVTLEEAWGKNWDYLWLWQLDQSSLNLADGSVGALSASSKLWHAWQLPLRDYKACDSYIKQLIAYLFAHTKIQIITGRYLYNGDGSYNFPSKIWDDSWHNFSSWPLNPYSVDHKNSLDLAKTDHAPTLDKLGKIATSPNIDLNFLSGCSSCTLRSYLSENLKLENRSPSTQEYPFITPADRGKMLHASLSAIWQQIAAKNCIARPDINQIRPLIAPALTQTITALQLTVASDELAYFTALLEKYFFLELQREPFKPIIINQIHKVTIDIEGSEISVHIDRVDEIDDGRKILVVYKTGKTVPSQWQLLSSPLQDLKIPVACLALRHLSIAQIAIFHLYSIDSVNCKLYTLEKLHSLAVKQNLLSSNVSSVEDWWTAQLNSLVRYAKQNSAHFATMANSANSEYCRLCPYRGGCHRACA